MKGTSEGFLLMEVLILLLILSVTFVSFMAVMGQALHISARSREITEAVSICEQFLFELENGFRSEVVSDGGHGVLEKDYQYEIRSEENSDSYSFLKGRVLWKKGNEFLDLDFIAPEGAVE